MKENNKSLFSIELKIFLGIISIVFCFSILAGVREYMGGNIFGFGRSIIFLEAKNGNNFDNRDIKKIMQIKEIKEVAFGVVKSVTLNYNSQKMSSKLAVVTPNFLQILNRRVKQGRLFLSSDVKNKAPVSLITSKIEEELFFGKNSIGQKLKINDGEFEVVGVIQPQLLYSLRGYFSLDEFKGLKDINSSPLINLLGGKEENIIFIPLTIKEDSFNELLVEISPEYACQEGIFKAFLSKFLGKYSCKQITLEVEDRICKILSSYNDKENIKSNYLIKTLNQRLIGVKVFLGLILTASFVIGILFTIFGLFSLIKGTSLKGEVYIAMVSFIVGISGIIAGIIVSNLVRIFTYIPVYVSKEAILSGLAILVLASILPFLRYKKS